MRDTAFEGLPALSRARRFSIGDLMAAVVLIALGMAVLSLLDRSGLDRGRQAGFGVWSLLSMTTLLGQWPLARIRTGDLQSWSLALVGMASAFLAMTTFGCLLIVCATFPEGAVLVVCTMLTLVVYLTTWD